MSLIFNQHFLDFSLGTGWGMIGINWKQMVILMVPDAFHCHWFFVYCMSPYTYPIFIIFIIYILFIDIQIFIIMIHGGNAVYLMLISSIVCMLFLILFATFSFEDEVSPELTQPLIFICHAIHLEVVALGSKTSDIQCFSSLVLGVDFLLVNLFVPRLSLSMCFQTRNFLVVTHADCVSWHPILPRCLTPSMHPCISQEIRLGRFTLHVLSVLLATAELHSSSFRT